MIVYEDGDAEELFEDELAKIVYNKKRKVHKKQRLSPPVLNTRLDTALLTGTMRYSQEGDVRCHIICGVWTYMDSSPLEFNFVRELSLEEELEALPKSGTFEGSFMYEYCVNNLKMSDIITENDVKISFTPKEENDQNNNQNSFSVKASGTNRFGFFKLSGTAKKREFESEVYDVRLRKKYVTLRTVEPTTPQKEAHKSFKEHMQQNGTFLPSRKNDQLPPPSTLYPTGVICLRGQLTRSRDPGNNNIVVQKIEGLWAPSFDTILANSGNPNGLCNRFKFQLKYLVNGNRNSDDDCNNDEDDNNGGDERGKSKSSLHLARPLPGRFSGWFYMDGKKIQEEGISIQFLENSEGQYNIKSQGLNDFGQYKITGTLVWWYGYYFSTLPLMTGPASTRCRHLVQAVYCHSAHYIYILK